MIRSYINNNSILLTVLFLLVFQYYSVNAQSKTRIEVKGAVLTVNGTKVSMPCEIIELKKLLGEPDRSIQMANLISTWDKLGVLTYQANEMSEVESLSVVLNTADDTDLDFSPKKTFSGELVIDGVTIKQDISYARINKSKSGAKFKRAILMWKMTNPSLTVYITRALKGQLTESGKIVVVSISPTGGS